MTFSDRAPFPARGFHAYCGKFPSSPPVLNDPNLTAAGFGYAQEDMVVDPRSLALDSETSIAQLNLSYDLNESTSLSYRFGYVDHEANSYGTAEGRASLIGSSVAYAPVQETPFPPFLQQLGPPGSMGALGHASTFNANPAESLEATSHELRLSWTGERVSARAGLYRSRNEDEDGGTFYFVPPCDSLRIAASPPWKPPVLWLAGTWRWSRWCLGGSISAFPMSMTPATAHWATMPPTTTRSPLCSATWNGIFPMR